MNKRFFFAIIVVVTVACKSNYNHTQNVLPVDTMKVVMFEMLSAEELSNMIVVKDTLQKGKKLNVQFYQEILKKHHLTKEAFYASYKYFDTRPDKMKILLDSVTAYAERMKQKENDRLYKKNKF